MSLRSKIESLLFITTRPLSLNKISELVEEDKDLVKNELEQLYADYNLPGKGVNLQKIGANFQFVTSADNTKLISEFLKEEITGELTQASLETLTVIAYRGPITRAELELIRGVNCSIILRNLMIRGLIEEIEDKKNLVERFQITFDFLKHLGITEPGQLPEYEQLNSAEALEQLLTQGLTDNKPVISEDKDLTQGGE